MHTTARLLGPLFLLAGLAACSDTTAAHSTLFTRNPCTGPDTLVLAVAEATRMDCSNGGTTVTLAGDGASYLIVPEFATDNALDQFVEYNLASGDVASTSAAAAARAMRAPGGSVAAPTGTLPPVRPNVAQRAIDRFMLSREAGVAAAARRAGPSLARAARPPARAVAAPPDTGSVRSFKVLSNYVGTETFATVGAKLEYVGANVLLYVDTLAPAGGFTQAQLQAFGQYFDQTLFPIDTAAFALPSDVDTNGHVIMLLSPTVNQLTTTSDCETQGFVGGFFEPEDFSGSANSNNGEVFYGIVPDPNGVYSCAHSVDDLESFLPAVFLHELQHLICFSQHVIIGGGDPESSWLDEGQSIVAEELGAVHYEQMCPPPSCRTDPSQLFPDSAQGFVQDFLYDSYVYALLPDTASVTLHSDADDGLSWRGGDWLLVRWLSDQAGPGFLRRLEQGPADGVADIEAATGQSFPQLFANFGLALYTDSLPGLPRTTAPAADRFTSRNVKQLWARVYATSGPSTDFPLEDPVQLFAVTSDTTQYVLDPGTVTYFRLDTPANAATVTIRFAGPGGTSFDPALQPQMAIFRLPAGQ